MRMEIDEFETPAQSAANGVVCAAGEPSYHATSSAACSTR